MSETLFRTRPGTPPTLVCNYTRTYPCPGKCGTEVTADTWNAYCPPCRARRLKARIARGRVAAKRRAARG